MMSAINQANQPNQWETQLGNQANSIQSFLDSKDYRNLPNGVNIPMLGLADQQKMRGMLRGSDAGAQRAAGANFAPMVQAQRELDDNQFAQDYGGEYENQIGGLIGRRDNLLSGLAGQGNQRSQQNVANYGGYANALLNTPQTTNIWSSLLPSLIQGGANAALQAF